MNSADQSIQFNSQKLRNILCHELNVIFNKYRRDISGIFTTNGIAIDLSQCVTLEDHSDGLRLELHILSGK